MWICIAPCHEHTSKVLRYGTRSQGISQFYLYTPCSSAKGLNHTCLCLPSQSWYSFTDPRQGSQWSFFKAGAMWALHSEPITTRLQTGIHLTTPTFLLLLWVPDCFTHLFSSRVICSGFCHTFISWCVLDTFQFCTPCTVV